MEIVSIVVGILVIIFVIGLFYPEQYYKPPGDPSAWNYQDNEDSQREYFSDIYAPKKMKQEHLHSEYWKVLKQRRLILVGGYKCEACGKHTHKLDLHHVTYEYLTFEKLEDVRLLCGGPNGCHNKLHKLLGYDRATRYPIEILEVLNNK